ncbi:hypothetical protein PFISCL1PPCAC_5069, partial [Pristionchus fissidentatus]
EDGDEARRERNVLTRACGEEESDAVAVLKQLHTSFHVTDGIRTDWRPHLLAENLHARSHACNLLYVRLLSAVARLIVVRRDRHC